MKLPETLTIRRPSGTEFQVTPEEFFPYEPSNYVTDPCFVCVDENPNRVADTWCISLSGLVQYAVVTDGIEWVDTVYTCPEIDAYNDGERIS